MKLAKENLTQVKKLVIGNVIITLIVFMLTFFVAQLFRWEGHPDEGDEGVYYYFEVTILALLLPILINMVLGIVMLIVRMLSDKYIIIQIGKKYSVAGIFVNLFQAVVILLYLVFHIEAMGTDTIIAKSYIPINAIMFLAGILIIWVVVRFVKIIGLLKAEKRDIEEGKTDRWN